MRLVATLACIIVAADAGEKALGIQEQSLLAPHALWTWWLVAAGWAVVAIAIMIKGAP